MLLLRFDFGWSIFTFDRRSMTIIDACHGHWWPPTCDIKPCTFKCYRDVRLSTRLLSHIDSVLFHSNENFPTINKKKKNKRKRKKKKNNVNVHLDFTVTYRLDRCLSKQSVINLFQVFVQSHLHMLSPSSVWPVYGQWPRDDNDKREYGGSFDKMLCCRCFCLTFLCWSWADG